jgi:hypothetical protein
MVAHPRGVLTMAYGSDRYLEMAKSLARSLILHSPDVPRAVVTDSSDRDIRALFHFCIPLRHDLGFGNRQKLHLDEYTPFGKTLFIDSDCLVVRDVDGIWPQLMSLPFGIPGDVKLRRGDQDPKMDVDYILNHFNLTEVSKFNSGLIYFDSSEVSVSIFATARTLLAHYEELRFSRHERPYDEPLFAVAMALHGISTIQDGGTTMRTPTGLRGPLQIDVRRGFGRFNKYGVVVEPAVVHFAGNWAQSFEYQRECFRLRHPERKSGYSQGLALARLRVVTACSGVLIKTRGHLRIRSRSSALKKCLLKIFG